MEMATSAVVDRGASQRLYIVAAATRKSVLRT